MLNYQQWAQRWPQAAQELHAMLQTDPNSEHDGKSEAWAQQKVRMDLAKMGGRGWRNNVGATKAEEEHRCPGCGFKFTTKNQIIRWGLANDSAQLNERIKSSDVIACVPVVIQPHHVGTTFGRFVTVEVKKPGWVFNPNDPHQVAQANWLSLCASLGAHAQFSTGELHL